MATHTIVDHESISATVTKPADSYENLLADVIVAVDGSISKMSEPENRSAGLDIDAIAETVRKRQEQAAGQ